ncbi:MAG TPA: site-specific integrase [Gammaproteobacteria bacterium]|nr:site-specific integrase [Gammaproteobacteria bacterium]
MSLYKRGEFWWVRFTTPAGKRVRQSTGTDNREAAEEYHDQLKAECWRVERLGERAAKNWNEAAVQWLKETGHKATHYQDKATLRWLDPFLGGKLLSKITRELVVEIAEAKALEASPSTANRHLALIRAILRKARDEWEWVERIPKIKLYPVKNQRTRWITRKEAERLLSLLPAHQARMARFSLSTGLRQRNVTGFEWTQVDLKQRLAWIYPDQAKARKPIGVPLNEEAVGVLRECLGQHERFVFTYHGRPITQVNTKAWRDAVRKAGLEPFRWHDLRHTWASWHAQAGTPLNVLQELGGWASAEMVQRYAHLGVVHLREHAERIAPARGTKLAHARLRLVK